MKLHRNFLICLLAVAAVLLCLLVWPQTAQAATESNLTFEYSSLYGGYVVTDCQLSATGHLEIPDTVNGIPVTHIYNWAFDKCKNLTSVTIPNSVTSIGIGAFQYCSGLTSITIPDSITSIEYSAFQGCTSLTSIAIPESVIYIGSSAFRSCTSLTSITIPDSITSIESQLFFGCTSLTSITISKSVSSIGTAAFGGCSNMTNLLVEEGNSTYHSNGNCIIETAKRTIVAGCKASQIPADGSVISIGEGSFYYCTSLTNINIPDSIINIGDWAFCGAGLSDINIPNSVTTIGTEAFSNCDGLYSLTIGNGVLNIRAGAFDSASNLRNVYITDASAWCKIDFEDENANPLYASFAYLRIVDENGEYLSNIVLDNTVTTIPSCAFQRCVNYASITIPNSVTSVGEQAFYWYDNLRSVTYCGTQEQWDAIAKGNFNDPLLNTTIQFHNYEDGVCSICRKSAYDAIVFQLNKKGNGYIVTDCDTSATGEIVIPAIYNGLPVLSIGDSAFSSCKSLTSIMIPYSVTDIGRWVFNNCEGLTSLKVEEGNAAYHSTANCIIETSKKKLIAGCKNSLIPDDGSVTAIGLYAFSGCKDLTSITIPVSITSIDQSAFSYCTGLTNVNIPSSVTSIGADVFWGCTGLTSITLSDSVTRITDGVFSGCSSLRNVIYCGTREQWDAIEVGSNNWPLTKVDLQFHDYENSVCTICGNSLVAGEMDGVEGVTCNDAIYLLLNILFGEENYPLNGADGDIDGNGTVNQDDAVYLLLHSLFGNAFYPLKTY